jgi:hypothetical protein
VLYFGCFTLVVFYDVWLSFGYCFTSLVYVRISPSTFGDQCRDERSQVVLLLGNKSFLNLHSYLAV